jgi:hypothetical protein
MAVGEKQKSAVAPGRTARTNSGRRHTFSSIWHGMAGHSCPIAACISPTPTAAATLKAIFEQPRTPLARAA